MSEENNQLPSVDEMPVLQDAVKGMKLDMAVGDNGDVFIFHEKPMPEKVNWLEYDREVLKLYFISEVGRIQGVGMVVRENLDEIVSTSRRVFLIHREDGRTITAYEMPLVHQVE